MRVASSPRVGPTQSPPAALEEPALLVREDAPLVLTGWLCPAGYSIGHPVGQA